MALDRDHRIAFGCVTEPTPKYLNQALRLVLSLRWLGGSMANADFLMGFVEPAPPSIKRFLSRQRVKAISVDRFDSSHGPSNKLTFLAHEALEEYSHVAMLDCDTIIVRDPFPWLFPAGIAAKPADLPTVTTEQLRELFDIFSVDFPDLSFEHDITGEPCIPYVNSGVVIINNDYRDLFCRTWTRFNREIVDRKEEMPNVPFHADQASLALALAETAIPYTALPSSMNMPVHLDSERYPSRLLRVDPVIIHYHGFADADRYIMHTPCVQANRRIDSFNARLRAEKRDSARMDPPKWPIANHPNKKIIVGSGWWSSHSNSNWLIGAPDTRAPWFFTLWHRQIVRCISPEHIVVTDSHSPLKPDHASFEDVEWIELDRNYGHANDIGHGIVETKYCGFTRSVLNGAMYALCCDADYYVYVEQDCLIHGADFLSRAIGDSDCDILIGMPTEGGKGLYGKPALPMMQQSLMIVKRSGFERFICGLLEAEWSDGQVSPEETMRRQYDPLDTVRLPYGRSRPIDFNLSHFYAQHLTEDELKTFCKMVNFDPATPLSPFLEI